MTNLDYHALLMEGLRLIMILGLPMIAIPIVFASLAGIVQSFLSIREDSLLYVARILGLAVALRLGGPPFWDHLVSFATAIFQ